ncbi:phage tail protein, partial [Sporolactobacillus shoreicorticis]
GWGKIKPLKTLIEVRDFKRKKRIFKGRVLKPTQTMTSDGLFSIEYACEDRLAYFNDSNQRFGEYHNITVRDFLGVMLENHNRQVEPYKQFKLGNVTVTDPNDSLYRYLGYDKTYATIKDKLLDRLGGFLVIREESDGNYLDYLVEVGENSETEIRLRSNLKDMKREIDPLDVITRLVPLGAKIESDNPDDTGASKARITIADVNGGKDYLDDPDMIAEFGIIVGTLELDDVSDKATLKAKGQQFLAQQKAAKITYSITPVDVSLINSEFDELEAGNRYAVVNPVFGINERLQVIEKDNDLVNPLNISLTIGDKYQTLIEYQRASRKQVKSIVQLERTVESQTQTIGTLKTELDSVDDIVQSVQQALTDGDIPGLRQGVENLQAAVDDLNNAIDNLPTYGPATPITDGLMSSLDKTKLDDLQSYEEATPELSGLMSAVDKAKLDDLQSYEEATSETAGLMPATDKAKLDLITVLQEIDLNDLVSRVEALEGGTG